MKKKRIKHIRIVLCVFLMCTIGLFGVWRVWFDPYRGTVKAVGQSEKLSTLLTRAQAAEDLEFIVNRLRQRHPACVHGLPAEVQDAYQQECAKLSNATEVTVLSLWQSAARILSPLGDAHTMVRAYYKDTEALPLSFAWEGQRLVCSGGEYDGDTVIEIGGVPVARLYQQFLTQFSYELDGWARHAFASRIHRGDYLAFVGINTEQEIEVLLEQKRDGNRINKTFVLQHQTISASAEMGLAYHHSIDETSGIGIFTLRQCTYDPAYKAALKEFFTLVQDNGIDSIILDLRNNPGGNSLVGTEFLRYLPVEYYQTGSSQVRFGPILWTNQPERRKNKQEEPVFSGDVYVLTGTDSFSSAMDFATLLSDNGLCTVIGEPPGNMPSSYGDILYFQTPNARLAFTISYKYFVRPDASQSHLPLLPHVQVPARDALAEAIKLIEGHSD